MRKNLIKFVTMTAFAAILFTGCAQKEENKDTTNNTTNVVEDAKTEEPVVADGTVYPLTIDIYDVNGEKITQTFEQAPTKVVTNNPSSTDLLLELGLQDRIIGIMKPDNTPAQQWASAYETFTVLGDKKTMSKEVIIGAEPEMIFGRAMPFTDDSMGLITDLNDMGINVYTQYASNFVIEQSLDNIILDVRNIGTIFDVSEKANAYADTLQTQLDEIRTSMEAMPEAEAKKVLFMVAYNDGTFNTFGANSTLQSEMLKTINATNVLDMGTSSLTSENLVALNPDVIVYVKSDRNAATDETAVASLLADETIQGVPAVAENSIIEIDYDDLMDYGVRVLDTLTVLYDFMYVK